MTFLLCSKFMPENLVLYRKYRPQSFKEIIAQEHIVQTLQNSIKADSISHAYLFTGPRGSGKTTIARIFAKTINCQKPVDANPCNKCDSCLEITNGNSMDLIEIDAASHTGVDEVRELISGIKFAPVKSKYKIFIIDECHQLSKAAANALLKTLEEPPSHAIFMLATTEAHKMIATIISRCQRFDFKRLHSNQIIEKLKFILKKEGVKFEESALNVIALNARGSFRDAESLLDKCMNFSGDMLKTQDIKELLGMVEVEQISKLVDFIVRQATKEALLYINQMADEGIDLQEFTKTLVFYLRQALMLKINPEFLAKDSGGLTAEEVEVMKTQIAEVKEKDLQNWLEKFIEAEQNMKYATILQLPLELAIVDICTSGA